MGALKGRIILLGGRRREVRSLLQLPVYPQGTHRAAGMRQAAPWCPHISQWSSAPPSSMDPGHGLWGQPGSARGCPLVPGGRALTLCCLSCRTPATASLGGCWPLGIPTASFPEAPGSQPEPQSGSNPWSGAAAGAGSRCQTKGRGQRPGCLVPQGRGAGACRARVLSHPGAAAAPTSRACHAPVPTWPPPWLA